MRQIAAVPPIQVNQLLFEARNVDLAVQDQDFALTKKFEGSFWLPTRVIVKRVSGAFSGACAGGIYTAAAKGGTAIVAATQSYASLTGAGTMTTATLATVTTTDVMSAIALFLNLTDNNGAALVADVFVYGQVVI